MSAKGMPRDILTPSQREEVVAAYARGDKYREIAARYGVTLSAVWGLISRRGVLRDRRIVQQHEIDRVDAFCREQRCNIVALEPIFDLKPQRLFNAIDETVFDTINPESAYWIGLLMADGAVVNRQFILQLSKPDHFHVFKFAEFLKSSSKVSMLNAGRTSQGCNQAARARLAVSSNKVIARLEQFGVIKKKSLTAEVKLLENHPDFWRGVIDGDGHVNPKVKGGVSIVSSHTLIRQFANFVKKITLVPPYTVAQGNSSRLHLNGKNGYLVLHSLYKYGTISLDRKHKYALEYINRFQITS